jgi:hypothetical protein
MLSGTYVHDRPSLFVLALLWSLPAVAALWLSYFRLRFEEAHFSYSCLFARTRIVRYSDIQSVTWDNSAPYPYRQPKLLVRLLNGTTFHVIAKPFPDPAIKCLIQLSPRRSNQRLERP